MTVRRALALIGAVLCTWPLMLALVLAPVPAWAGPVNWQEVPPTAEGRQWWDAGSLRLSRNGSLTVLSRFQPAAPAPEAGAATRRAEASKLYVMELDCDQELYRDISINGFPQFRAQWQAASGDALSTETIRAACTAGGVLRSAAAAGETG